MKKAKVAIVYARTLLESAAAQKSQEAVSADMRLLSGVFGNLPELARFLANPVLKNERKAALLESAARQLAPLTRQFLKLLELKNRFPILPQIVEEYVALEEKQRNILRATVYSAIPLAAEQVERMARNLEKQRPGKKFILTNQIDPSLIAGFRIREGDTITDASIRYKLELLRQKLAA